MLATMLVFLVRHAHADPGDPDELRRLSERGQQEAQALADRLAGHDTPPSLVISSPLRRALETAEKIVSATGAELRPDERLAPGATASDLRAVVSGEHGPVAIVAHQPDCSEIATELTSSDPGFPTGGAFEISLET
jgi:phosphohistidine phosphatase